MFSFCFVQMFTFKFISQFPFIGLITVYQKNSMKKLLFIMSFLMGILVFPHKAISQVDISITANVAPPELPVYSQPSCPVNGYLWTPGYWAYDNGDYY